MASVLDTTLLSEVSGGVSLDRIGGIYVAQLEGSYEEMGRQHAALAASACGDVVTRYLDGLIEKIIAHALPSIAHPAAALLKRYFHYRNAGKVGDDMRALIAGLALGFNIPAPQAERVIMVPDILHYLAGRAFVPLAVPPMCSGFYAANGATRDGKQLIGRNFDFFGRGVWNECNALVVMRPTSGQRMCWIGALGAPCGPQGFNESGLCFSLHTNFTRDVNSSGIPLFSLCHKIMARCTTLDEAIACIKAEPRLCGLSIFLADTRARRAAVVGFSARHEEVVYPENDVLVRTNHYVTPAMQENEMAPHPWQQNSRGRFRRVHELLSQRHGALVPQDGTAILSDCMDTWENRERVTGNIVACVNTTQSMVMSPDDDTLWLARADHPVSHARSFTGFSMSALLDGNRDAYACGDIDGGGTLEATQREALAEYAEAWSEYFDNLNSDAAVFRLRRAAMLLPDEPIFPRMAGILLMKLHRYEQALSMLAQNAAYPHEDPMARAESHMWLARCLDLMNRRDDALTEYRKAMDVHVEPVSGAARRHMTKPFRRLDLFDVAPEFIVGTAIAKYRSLN